MSEFLLKYTASDGISVGAADVIMEVLVAVQNMKEKNYTVNLIHF